MSTGRPVLSVDIGGIWPIRKALKVVEAFSAEAEAAGFSIEMLEVTVFGDQYRKVLLQLCCLRHGTPVPESSACEQCLMEAA